MKLRARKKRLSEIIRVFGKEPKRNFRNEKKNITTEDINRWVKQPIRKLGK